MAYSPPYLFLLAEDATLNAATFVSTGASPNQMRTVNYADAATQGAEWTVVVPSNWAGKVITAQIYWSPGATDAVAHTVRWTMTCKSVAVGGNVTAAGTATTFTGASAARTINLLVKDTATSTGVTPAAIGDVFSFGLQRIGADGADTYVGAVRVHGVLLTAY